MDSQTYATTNDHGDLHRRIGEAMTSSEVTLVRANNAQEGEILEKAGFVKVGVLKEQNSTVSLYKFEHKTVEVFKIVNTPEFKYPWDDLPYKKTPYINTPNIGGPYTSSWNASDFTTRDFGSGYYNNDVNKHPTDFATEYLKVIAENTKPANNI